MAKKKPEIPQLPKGCGYMGREFGASYLDSECFGGQLYDLDNCDEPGTLNEPMEYLPCPQCRHEEWLNGVLEDCEERGAFARDAGLPRTPPYVATKMKYPDDIQRMQTAWYRGWDAEDAESSAQ